MSNFIKISKYLLIIFLILFACSCAASRKNPYYKKKKAASHINTEQLGRNRYYFSPGYQKKLNSTFKKKNKKF